MTCIDHETIQSNTQKSKQTGSGLILLDTCATSQRKIYITDSVEIFGAEITPVAIQEYQPNRLRERAVN